MQIVLATDGSDNANAALELLAARPANPDERVVVITAVPTAPLLGNELEPPPDTHADSLSAAADAIVDAALARLREAGHEASGIVRLGNPVDLLLDTIAEERADLIVLGARGVGRVRRFLVGSVAERIARTAPCSVLAVREPGALQPAVIATDGSAAAARAVDRYVQLLAGQPATAIALQVNPEPGSDATAAISTRAPALQIEPRTATGNEVEAILETAAAREARLIVVGAKPRAHDDEPYLGTVAYGILTGAAASVLVGR